MALETVLENLRTKLKTIRDSGFDDHGYNIVLEAEYRKLSDKGLSIVYDPNYTRNDGATDVNRPKNRFKDIIPCEHRALIHKFWSCFSFKEAFGLALNLVHIDIVDKSRVRLEPVDGIEGSDYINASQVADAYIAAQGPLPNTVNDFVRMIWEKKCKVIVMACKEIEGGKKRCERYFPTEKDETITFDSISMTLLSSEEKDDGQFIIRHLQLSRGSENREAIHLQYTAWPDHGTPQNVDPILDIIETARRRQPFQDTEPCLLIHCSAGCGRTGTLIVIDYIWRKIKARKVKQEIDLLATLMKLREDRQALVQTSEQYEFVLVCLEHLIERELLSTPATDSNSVYYNWVQPDRTDRKGAIKKEQSLFKVTDTAAASSRRGNSATIVINSPPSVSDPKSRAQDQRQLYENISLQSDNGKKPSMNGKPPDIAPKPRLQKHDSDRRTSAKHKIALGSHGPVHGRSVSVDFATTDDAVYSNIQKEPRPRYSITRTDEYGYSAAGPIKVDPYSNVRNTRTASYENHDLRSANPTYGVDDPIYSLNSPPMIPEKTPQSRMLYDDDEESNIYEETGGNDQQRKQEPFQDKDTKTLSVRTLLKALPFISSGNADTKRNAPTKMCQGKSIEFPNRCDKPKGSRSMPESLKASQNNSGYVK